MFKLVTGGNGRNVCMGKVTNVDGEYFTLSGADWDKKTKKEIPYNLELKNETENVTLTVGETIIAMILPHRKDPNKGVAEEIAKSGECMSIINDHGNEKVILYGKIHNKKWNQSHSVIRLAFRNIKDTEGNMVGQEVSYKDQFNFEYSTHWLNVSFFQGDSAYNAEKADKRLEKGKEIILVCTRKESVYQGKNYINYLGAKFSVL